MKGDDFVSWVTRATLWVEENSRTVLMGLGGAVVVIIAAIGVFSWVRYRQDEAFVLLGEVQKAAKAVMAGEAAGPDALPARERPLRVIEAADRLLRERGSAPAAEWARYYRASALLDLGRHGEAAEGIRPLIEGGDDSLLAELSRMLAGRIEEARANYERAAEYYATAAERAGEHFPAEVALMDQARCLDTIGRRQEAINAYQKILDAYPDSPLADRVGRRLQDLKGSAQGL